MVKEIISADVYGDTQEIIEDCLKEIEPFMEKVLPELHTEKFYDLTIVHRRNIQWMFQTSSDMDVLEIAAGKFLPAA